MDDGKAKKRRKNHFLRHLFRLPLLLLVKDNIYIQIQNCGRRVRMRISVYSFGVSPSLSLSVQGERNPMASQCRSNGSYAPSSYPMTFMCNEFMRIAPEPARQTTNGWNGETHSQMYRKKKPYKSTKVKQRHISIAIFPECCPFLC